MALGLILPTIQNKLSCLALCKDGALSKFPFTSLKMYHLFTYFSGALHLNPILTKQRVSYVDVKNIPNYWAVSLS